MAEAERIIGTPDNPEAEHADDGGSTAADAAVNAGTGKRKILVLIGVAVVAYLLDLVSKLIVVAKLEHQPPIDIIGDWLQFRALRNPGAAFGFGEAFTVIFTIIAAGVIVVVIRLARKLYSLPWAIALGLLLGRVLGTSPTASSGRPACSKGPWSTSSPPSTSPSSTSRTPPSCAAASSSSSSPSRAWTPTGPSTRTDRAARKRCAQGILDR
ncbi:Lipoprotein signal peptidase [Streptomyces microflavus]